jgi:Trk-type K+ transport system membrane component
VQSAEATSFLRPVESARTGLSLAGTITWAYLILLLLGFVVFRQKGTLVLGNEMSPERAAFVVVNAGTLTGFQLNLAIDQYHAPGHWMMLALTIGGTLFALVSGGMAVSRIARLPYSDWHIVVTAVCLEIVMLALGTVGLLHKDQSIFVNLFEAASAFGNSGAWMGAKDTVENVRVHTVLLPLAVIGGLGIPVLLDLGAVLGGRRKPSNHTVTALWTTAIVYVAGTGAIFSLQWLGSAAEPQFEKLLAMSSATSLNARTPGLPFQLASQWARTTQWLVIGLMAIGASPGGAGGGLKSTIVPVFASGVWNIVRGETVRRIFGIAIVWIAAYSALVLIPFFFLLHTEPDLDPDRVLFIVVSAASNVGLAHERISIAGGGQITLCATMLLGRLLPLVVLWWTVMSAPDSDVAVG